MKTKSSTLFLCAYLIGTIKLFYSNKQKTDVPMEYNWHQLK